MAFSWSWACLFGVCAGFAVIPFIGIEHPSKVVWSLFRLSVQAIFLYVFGSIVVRSIWVVWRNIQNFWHRNTATHDEIDPEKVQHYEAKRHILADDQQEKYCAQAESYKKAILEPRERAKIERKERHLANVLGQHFTGQGRKLGSGIPVSVTHQQDITLPEEPPEDDPSAVTVTIDNSKGQRHTRRFSPDDTIQNLNDYMSTLGFVPENYSLCTAYPRQPLPARPQMTLQELNLSRRTLLFVQEKYDDSD